MIGIDIVHVDDIQALLKCPRAVERTFTENELQWCRERADDCVPALARFFAAKEALIKAVGQPEGYFRRIEIVHPEPSGRPCVNWARIPPGKDACLSLSYRDPFAIAVAILMPSPQAARP